jgi:hypothetical protein
MLRASPRSSCEVKIAMLEFASSDAVRTTGDAPDVCLLNPETLLLIWDMPTRLWAVPKLETTEGKAISPQATLRLPLNGGGTRLLRLIRRPKAAKMKSPLIRKVILNLPMRACCLKT